MRNQTFGAIIDQDLEWLAYDHLPPHWREFIRNLPVDCDSITIYKWYRMGYTIGQWFDASADELKGAIDEVWDGNNPDPDWDLRVGQVPEKAGRRRMASHKTRMLVRGSRRIPTTHRRGKT